MEENDVTYVWYQSEYKSANFMTDELREELNTFGSHPLWMYYLKVPQFVPFLLLNTIYNRFSST